MKTITKTLYLFGELPTPQAQINARSTFFYRQESFVIQDYWNLCQAIEKAFYRTPVKIDLKSIDVANADISYRIFDETTSDTPPLSMDQLALEYPTETDCPFTGTYTDHTFTESIRNAETNAELLDILPHALRALAKEAQTQYDYENSDESLSESSEANEYYFDAQGNYEPTE